MRRHPLFKVLSLYLIVALSALSFPAAGWAMLLPAAQAEATSPERARVQAALESSVIKQRLMDHGLTPEETAQRLSALSDEQVHRLAADLEAVQAGGSVAGDVAAILLIIVIVIVILELTGHHVVMKH